MNPSLLIPAWLRAYRREDLRFDLVAGLTVGVMLIPQGMAYAMLAGMPPIYGLYASSLPALAYVWLGTSRQLSVGPGALTALLTAAGISVIAIPQSEAYFTLIAMLTLTVGLIQFSLGALRMGFLINFLSHPVMQGFTLAAAILIGFSQLRHLFGIVIDYNTGVPGMLREMILQAPLIHLPTMITGTTALLILLLLRKLRPGIPAALIVVILAILTTWLFRLDETGLPVAGVIPTGLPVFRFAAITVADVVTLFPTAFAIALVSFMESTAVARIIRARHKTYNLVTNRELVALGLANIMSAWMKSIPVTGGMSRSMVNDHAGARTGLSSAFSSALVLLVLLFFAPSLYYLPNAVLAAIILVAVSRLLKFRDAVRLWKLDRKDFLMMAATFTGTIFFGIGPGIATGVCLSLAWIIFETSYPHHAELGRIPGTRSYRNIQRYREAERPEGVLIYRFDAPLFFANIDRFCEVLREYKSNRHDRVHAVIIDMDGANTIDTTALTTLADLLDDLRKENVQVFLTSVKGPVRDKLLLSGLTSVIGEDHFFATNEEAVERLNEL